MIFRQNDPSPELFEAVKAFAIDDVRAALDTDDKRVRDERLLPVYDKVHAEFDEKFPEEADKIDDCLYSSKNSLYVAGCWMTASVWMGAALMRSARWQQRLMCSSARTVPLCLPAARHRCSL